MMADTDTSDVKLRCVVAFRFVDDQDDDVADGSRRSTASTSTRRRRIIVLAKHDHARMIDSHASFDRTTFYGRSGVSYTDAIAKAIQNDPPPSSGGLIDPGCIGGFKVVQSDCNQTVYGADSDGLCLAIATGLDYPPRVAIQMLQELHAVLLETLGSRAVLTATENGLMTRKARTILSEMCNKYDDLDRVDKVSALQSRVNEVTAHVQSNISDMLKNTEKADSLATTSEQLSREAALFKKQSTTIKRQMAWKNLQWTLLLTAIILIIAIAILAPMFYKSN